MKGRLHGGGREGCPAGGLVPRACALCCVLLFLFEAANAAEQSPVFLWSVKGGQATVYLLGSIHVMKAGAYPLDDRIERAYKASKRVVFEADMKEAAGPAMRKALLAKGTYQDKTVLKDHVSEKTYGLLEQRLKKSGVPVSRFAGYRPWLCAVTISGLELKRLGFGQEHGIDAHFFTRAGIDGKKTAFLETSAFQIDLLSKALADRQEDLLLQTLGELEVMDEMSSEIVNAWKQGDAAKMDEIVNISLRGFPEIKKALFTERNARWASRIERFAKGKGDTLVIVGAGHLVGEDGVPALLEKRGYAPVRL